MAEQSHRGLRPASGALLALVIFIASTFAVARALDAPVRTIPAGTRIKIHVDAPISSNESKTGQSFSFELLDPIALADGSIAVEGTKGSGTVYLAGHAGSSGHEGDLTLRLDSLETADGHTFAFSDQRFKINGRNRKVMAGVLGFIPYAGMGARFIRGSDVRVEPTTPIETVLARPATTSTITLDPAMSPAPSPT